MNLNLFPGLFLALMLWNYLTNQRYEKAAILCIWQQMLAYVSAKVFQENVGPSISFEIFMF